MLTLILIACTPGTDSGATTVTNPALVYEAWEHACTAPGEVAYVPSPEVAPLLMQAWRLSVDVETGGWVSASAIEATVRRDEEMEITCAGQDEVLRVVYAFSE